MNPATGLADAGRAVEREAHEARRAGIGSWTGMAAGAADRARARAAADLAALAAALDLAARACAAHGHHVGGTGPALLAAEQRCAAVLAEARAALPLASTTAAGPPPPTSPTSAGAPGWVPGWTPPEGLGLGILRLLWGRPADLRRWWQSLSPPEQDQLVRALPRLVGAADGLPARDRDRANRCRLTADLASGARGAVTTAAVLDSVGDRIDPANGAPLPALLLDYDPAAFGGDGRAAVALGDPDLAEDVAVLVPGFGSDLDALPGVTRDALALQQAASTPGSPASVLAWIGYNAPDGSPVAPDADRSLRLRDAAGVAGESAAILGAARLDRLLGGLGLPGGTPADPPAHLTVVGHSYGSTTAAHAFAAGTASPGGPPADDLVLLGSPGAGGGAERAVDLHPGHGRGAPGVHVAADDHDPVTWLGGPGSSGLGPDPAQAAFGAHRLPTDPGDPLPRAGAPGLVEQARHHHGAYLDPDGRTLAAVADVVRGDPAPEVAGRTRPARSLLVRWITGLGPATGSGAH